jgi:hypothetical protein
VEIKSSKRGFGHEEHEGCRNFTKKNLDREALRTYKGYRVAAVSDSDFLT